jgi:hypothetical protein
VARVIRFHKGLANSSARYQKEKDDKHVISLVPHDQGLHATKTKQPSWLLVFFGSEFGKKNWMTGSCRWLVWVVV